MKTGKILLPIIFFTFFVFIVYYFYPESKIKADQKADKIIINKANHELLLYYKEALISTYKVSLGRNGLNKKTKQGDWLTPEGHFQLLHITIPGKPHRGETLNTCLDSP